VKEGEKCRELRGRREEKILDFLCEKEVERMSG
jgi:hypothetical protein